MKNKINVLTIGGAAQDIFLDYKSPEIKVFDQKTYILLEEGSKIDIKKLTYYTGGGAINSAFSFNNLNCDVSVFCKIGHDTHGQFILNELQKDNIETKNIKHSDTLQTAISLVISPPSRDRVILAYRGANIELKEEEIPEIKKIDQIYITSLSGDSAKLLLPITILAKKNNIPVAVNPGMKQIKSESKLLHESLKNIDTLILNAYEAQELMTGLLNENISLENVNSKQDISNTISGKLFNSFLNYKNNNLKINDYFKTILKLGPTIVVVTNGAEGVYVANKEFIYFHPSIKPENLVNTLGAGDSFGSTFVACLIQGKTIDEALIYGIINASSVISHEGAKTGLLKWHEIQEKFNKLNKSNIQKLPL